MNIALILLASLVFLVDSNDGVTRTIQDVKSSDDKSDELSSISDETDELFFDAVETDQFLTIPVKTDELSSISDETDELFFDPVETDQLLPIPVKTDQLSSTSNVDEEIVQSRCRAAAYSFRTAVNENKIKKWENQGIELLLRLLDKVQCQHTILDEKDQYGGRYKVKIPFYYRNVGVYMPAANCWVTMDYISKNTFQYFDDECNF